MKRYLLYLESGPLRRKTMVHVPELLGCMANGPTTEEALARTPGAIRAYLRLLQRHGGQVEVDIQFEVEIAEHVTEGIWLGNGDPSIVFGPDLEPLPVAELEELIQRLDWMRLEIVALVDPLDRAAWDEAPKSKGRPIRKVLEHILESEYAYMAAFGKIDGLPGTGSIVRKQEGDLLEWMAVVRVHEIKRLRELTPQQLSEPFVHWKHTRTARKVLRRMLEHQWEHLTELRERILSTDVSGESKSI